MTFSTNYRTASPDWVIFEQELLQQLTSLPDILPYLGAGVTLLSGIVGFFWARGGERNRVGGIGWAALALLIIGGMVTIVQTRLQAARARTAAKTAAAASKEAADLAEDLRRAQFAASAALLTLVGGFDLSGPVHDGNFYFSVDETVDGSPPVAHPAVPPGFIGPLPQLPPGAVADFEIWLDDIYAKTIHIARTPGGLRLRFEDGSASFLLRKNASFDIVDEPDPGHASSSEETGEAPPDWWTTSDEEGAPSVTIGEVAGSRIWGFSFAASNQYRRLVSQLVRQREYGELRVTLARSDPQWVANAVRGFETITPEMVFTPPLHPGRAADACGPSYLRVPMKMQQIGPADARVIVFKLIPAPRGIQTEVCEGGP